MKKMFLWVSLFLFITGCSSALLPSTPRDIESFIPQETIKKENNIPEVFDFYERNFPQNCRWEVLVRVVDGDTIVVDTEEKVRFIGIDTPESKDPDKPLQKGALSATDTTKELLKNSSQVCLISDPISDTRDVYNRTLSYIFTESGIDVNAELLLLGKAKGYFHFPFSRRLEFEAYQQKARDLGLGLWKR